MPVMPVLRAPRPVACCPGMPAAFPGEWIASDVEELFEALDALCSGEEADGWTDIPEEQQRKLRILQ